MKALKRLAYLVSTFLFSAFSLLAYAPQANANSYYGGNWKLTFYSPVDDEDTTQEVYTINPDGTDLQRITDDDGQQSNPQWSPSMSSRQLAFDQDDDLTDDQTSTGQDRNIYIQDIDSAGAANGAPTVLSGADTCENEWDPSWSPDGGTIAYHRTSDVRNDCSAGDAGGPNHIFTIDSAGGTAEARTGSSSTGTCDSTCDGDTRDTEPTWNMDGDTLVFTRTDTGDDSTDIATVPATGDEDDVEIIPGSDGGASPQWSPLTNTIVFQKGGEIWTYTVGDGTAEQLTSSASYPYAPTYSPDGTLIAATGSGTIGYYSASTGALVDTMVVATNAGLGYDSANGSHEIDWARASAPDDSVHECTTYVNEDCVDDDFDPEIPDECSTGNLSSIINAADDGTPSYSSGNFTYTPDHNYVGEDQYVYRYYDEYMNAITCTINITVLPRTPDSGEAPSSNLGLMAGSGLIATAIGSGYIMRRKRVFSRK